jgi:16S rRNA pseudouridine516 synthase
MRLDRFLSGQTAYSRKELTAMIRSGAVKVGGEVIRKPDTQIDPEQTAVTLRGEQIAYAAHHYYLLHKPAGVITASRDPKQKTVLDLLKPQDRLQGLFPSGRLDIDTEGLLLITDDGALSHQMLSPKHHVAKYYLAQLRDPFKPDYPAAFRNGILLREGDADLQCQPAECAAIDSRLAVLELHEGKYHQVRRMFAAVGNHVEKLLR